MIGIAASKPKKHHGNADVYREGEKSDNVSLPSYPVEAKFTTL